MLKQRFLLVLALLLLNSQQQVQATDLSHYPNSGNLPTHPQRIIAFPAGVVDSLDALGVALVGMPNGIHLSYISQTTAQSVGSLFNADLEAIHKLRPDLVMVGTRSAKQFSSVSEIAPTIDFSLPRGNTFKAAIARFDLLAELVDKQTQAKAIKDELLTLKDEVKALINPKERIMVVMLMGRSLNMLTEKTRIDWFHSELGMSLVGDDTKQLGELAPISFEYILAQNPDWLIVMDRDAAVGLASSHAQQQMDNPLVKATKAFQNKQIIYLDGVGTLNAVGGVQGLKGTLEQLRKSFQTIK